MSLSIQDFINQYVKSSSLRLGASEAAGDISGGGGGGGPVIPQDAKLYIPDLEGIFDDIFYILGNEPVDDDPVWENFMTSRVFNIETATGGQITASDLYVQGFYNENYDVEDNRLNIAYTGNLNFGAFEGEIEYVPAIVSFFADVDSNFEINGAVDLTLKSDITISIRYFEDNNEFHNYYKLGGFLENNVTILVDVIVDENGEKVDFEFNVVAPEPQV